MPPRYPKPPGARYRPSNGTEGDLFWSRWCRHCVRAADPDAPCEIETSAMAFDVGDEEYPREWVYDARGYPACTAFQETGTAPPPRCDKTKDLFE